jgi:4'-phosphopantetheinyl transferase EntD
MSPILNSTDDLHKEESACVQNAVLKRQLEFATGRFLARQLLRENGFGEVSIPSNADRTPKWPYGITGSITHSSENCAVAIAESREVRALGIDIETTSSDHPEIATIVCTAEEHRWLESNERALQPHLLRIFFSAKEAVYKCQYTLTGAMLEFHDVGLAIDLNAREFVAKVRRTAQTEQLPHELRGFIYQDDDLVLTGTKIT